MLLALLGASPPAAGQEPAPQGPPEAARDTADVPWGRYEGLWDLEDGRTLVVTDLVDQMPEDTHQLMVLEPFSGLVRTLHPTEGSDAVFAVGAGFFQLEPLEGSLTFHLASDAGADSVRWSGADGGVQTGRRSAVQEREVTFQAQDGVRLAGSLLLPPDSVAPPWPAVVFIHGSGALTRRSPRQVGYQLAAAGMAVLVFDKRGTGASEGTYRANAVEQQARDAVAALDFLRARTDVDPDRVAVHAASEGGFVAPMVLDARPDVAALICRVCSMLPWSEALPHFVRGQLEGTGVPAEQVDEAVAYVGAQVRFAQQGGDQAYADLVERYRAAEGSEWLRVLGLQPPAPPDGPSWEAFREFLAPDPTEFYRNLDIPVLVILGEADPRVPGDVHGRRARELLAGSPSPAWAVQVLPDANHGLMLIRRGPEGESLPPTRYAPDLHRDLVDWIRLILRSPDEAAVGADPPEGVQRR